MTLCDVEVLSADEPRRYELSPEYQRRVLADAPDGAWPIQDAPEIEPNLNVYPKNLSRRTLREAGERFGDDKVPGFSHYPIMDETGVSQYAMLWRDRHGKIRAALAVTGVEGFPPVPSELHDAARRWADGSFTKDDQQALLEWWKGAYFENPGLHGGKVETIAVDDTLPDKLRRGITKRLQTEAARHHVERKPNHELTADGARSLNNQRVKADELAAAAQAIVWAPKRVVGRIRFPDTDRFLTQGEIVRGLVDLAKGADDPDAGGAQFHYEASAVKHYFRGLVKNPKAFAQIVGFPLAELPPEAHILSQRRPDGGIDLSIADRSGAPLIREEAQGVQEGAAGRGREGPPSEPEAAAAAGAGAVPGGLDRGAGRVAAAGEELGGRVPEAEARPELIRPSIGAGRRAVVPTEPPKSQGHVAFAGADEFFTVTDSLGNPHVYQAPAQSTIDPTGVRTGARWVGPANQRTLDGILERARNFLNKGPCP